MPFDKTVLTVMKQWDYGRPERGVSVDKSCFGAALSELVSNVETIWYDEYLDNMADFQSLLLKRAQEISPDLIFFVPQHRHEFEVETLKQLKEQCPTMVWFGDDEWRFESFSSQIAPYFSHVVTTDPWSIDKYVELGVSPMLSAWAAQPHREPMPPLENRDELKYDVTFVGGANEVRKWFIRMLAKEGVRVECFGAGWKNGRVSYEEMYEIFRQSRINLNLSNSVSSDIRYVFGGVRNFARWLKSSKRTEQIKARNFEIPLAGGFQLTNYVPHLERYWDIGKEVAVYSSVDDCAKQIAYHLKHEDTRLEVAKKGYRRAAEEHTFKNRLNDVLQQIWT